MLSLEKNSIKTDLLFTVIAFGIFVPVKVAIKIPLLSSPLYILITSLGSGKSSLRKVSLMF